MQGPGNLFSTHAGQEDWGARRNAGTEAKEALPGHAGAGSGHASGLH